MHIQKPQKLSVFQRHLSEKGWDQVHVLADFDGTLTKTVHNGKTIPAIIAVLRQNGEYLGDAYAQAAQSLHKTYGPYEADHTLPMDIRLRGVEEWYRRHHELLKASGLSLWHLQKLVESRAIELKDGAAEFFAECHARHVPMVILSASGIGNVIPMYLDHQDVLTPDVHVIANQLLFDQDGVFLSTQPPLIHALNKDEISVSLNPAAHHAIEQRKVVLLLGDSLGDLGMVKGFPAEHVLAVGFSNEAKTESSAKYQALLDAYDIVIEGQSFDELNNVLFSK